MQFVSLQFLIFFLAVFLLAILSKENPRQYRVYLLFVSAAFYLSFGVRMAALLALNICVNYLLLRAIERIGKKALVLSVAVNLLFLAAFKYYNFGADVLLQVLNLLKMPADINVLRLLIPVGISFYTFRNISHQVDCYRRVLPVPPLLDYANYVAFFPQVISGPIVRAQEFYPFLREPTRFTYSQGQVITLILSGLIKKYVIASYLFNFVTGPFAAPTNYSSLDLGLAAVAYSIMLFVDFSGYSDFAIALSNLLGFDVQPNFLSPYRAIGLKDFWNRWHISLSAWLRDYVFFSIGGLRKSPYNLYRNLMLTMLLSGLWHGAGLTFVVWGALHGLGVVFSHYLSNRLRPRPIAPVKKAEPRTIETYQTHLNSLASEEWQSGHGLFVDVDEQQFNREVEMLLENLAPPVSDAARKPDKARVPPFILGAAKFLGWAATFAYVTFAWIFFTSPTISSAWSFISSTAVSRVTENKIFNLRLVVVVALVLLFNFIGEKVFSICRQTIDAMPLPARIPALALAVYLIFQLGPETVPPFIYFNF